MGEKDHRYNPIYKQSLEISNLGQAVASYFFLDGNFGKLKRTAGLQSEIAFNLSKDAPLVPKIFNEAVNSKSKEKILEKLAFINSILKNLLSYCNGLEHEGVKEKEYLNLLRNEVKLFRKSFKSFRKSLI